jgi:hypothetical protein
MGEDNVTHALPLGTLSTIRFILNEVLPDAHVSHRIDVDSIQIHNGKSLV